MLVSEMTSPASVRSWKGSIHSQLSLLTFQTVAPKGPRTLLQALGGFARSERAVRASWGRLWC